MVFDCQPQPHFKRKFDWLASHLSEHTAQKQANHIFCASTTQKERLEQILEELAPDARVHLWVAPLYRGFIDADEGIRCYTDHQLFERYHKFRLKNGYSKSKLFHLRRWRSWR